MSFAGKPNLPRSEGRRTKTGRLTKSASAQFSYQITRQGGRKTLPGAFVQRATRRSNFGGGFSAVSDQRAQAYVRQGRARFPLVVPRGPSLSAVYQQQDDIRRRVTDDARMRLPERIVGQSRRIYDRRWRRVA